MPVHSCAALSSFLENEKGRKRRRVSELDQGVLQRKGTRTMGGEATKVNKAGKSGPIKKKTPISGQVNEQDALVLVWSHRKTKRCAEVDLRINPFLPPSSVSNERCQHRHPHPNYVEQLPGENVGNPRLPFKTGRGINQGSSKYPPRCIRRNFFPESKGNPPN